MKGSAPSGRDSGRRAIVAALAGCLLAAAALRGGAEAGAATKWGLPLAGGSEAQAKSASPAAPTDVKGTCVSKATPKIKVTWLAATHATGYTVYESKTSGSYSSVATVTTTGWTSGTLTSGKYTFEVSTSIGSRWSSARSSATSSRTVSTTASTTKCK